VSRRSRDPCVAFTKSGIGWLARPREVRNVLLETYINTFNYCFCSVSLKRDDVHYRVLCWYLCSNRHGAGQVRVVAWAPALGSITISYHPLSTSGMSRLVQCTCRSHCLSFNPETQTYEGGGGLVSKSTAANHRRDDLLSESLDAFTENVATQVLGRSPPPESPNHCPPHPVPRDQNTGFHGQPPLDDFYFTLETETTYRCTWTPTNPSLVFFMDASPTLQYRYPSTSEMRTPNREPYSLDPRNTANATYLENENRLCEILRVLERRPVSDARDRLLARVYEGLEKMEIHKATEWNRQRARSIARHHGYSVVDTGTCDVLVAQNTILNAPEIRPIFRLRAPKRSSDLYISLNHPHSPSVFSDTQTRNCGDGRRHSEYLGGSASYAKNH